MDHREWYQKQTHDYPGLVVEPYDMPHLSWDQILQGIYNTRRRLAVFQGSERGLEGSALDAYVAAHLACPPHRSGPNGTMKPIDMDAEAMTAINRRTK